MTLNKKNDNHVSDVDRKLNHLCVIIGYISNGMSLFICQFDPIGWSIMSTSTFLTNEIYAWINKYFINHLEEKSILEWQGFLDIVFKDNISWEKLKRSKINNVKAYKKNVLDSLNQEFDYWKDQQVILLLEAVSPRSWFRWVHQIWKNTSSHLLCTQKVSTF